MTQEIHYIRYDDDDPEPGRHYWHCVDCGLGGSVSEFNDPGIAAENAHKKRYGDTVGLGTTTREY